MPIEPLAPLLFIQQMGPAGKFIKDAATHPEVSQNIFQNEAAAAFRQQGSQVQGVDGATFLIGLDEESQNNHKNSEKMFKEYQGKEPPEENNEEETEEQQNSSEEEAHLGNFVNRKV